MESFRFLPGSASCLAAFSLASRYSFDSTFNFPTSALMVSTIAAPPSSFSGAAYNSAIVMCHSPFLHECTTFRLLLICGNIKGPCIHQYRPVRSYVLFCYIKIDLKQLFKVFNAMQPYLLRDIYLVQHTPPFV